MSDARTALRERLVAVQSAMEAAEAHVPNACNGDYLVAIAVGPGLETARQEITWAPEALIEADVSPEG